MAAVSDEMQKVLRDEMKTCRTPEAHSEVEKDECLLSFDNPFSPSGLFTNLNTWKSYGKDYVLQDSETTKQKLYFHQKFLRIPKPKSEANADSNEKDKEKENDESKAKENENASKLGLGIAGGFAMDGEFQVHKEYNLVILPGFTYIKFDASNEDGYNDKTFPLGIVSCINGIIENSGMAARQGVKAFSAEDEVTLSKHSSNLVQLIFDDPKKKPSPKQADWKCANCSNTENLWFNLSDGYIGCGRKQYGGVDNACGAALQHFIDTGRKYPLAVKLGTITPQGGEVYSYDEDAQVLDKYLDKHLSHWGIDIMTQEKYESTTDEMQLDLNKNFAFGMIVEKGQKLENVRGAELVGLQNLGNTCYMNSLFQGLFTLPAIRDKYFKNSDKILKSAPPNADIDFVTQMAKLSVGLLTDRYVKQFEEIEKASKEYIEKHKELYKDDKKDDKKDDNNNGVDCVAITPRMLRNLVGQGHPEFSSSRQQDSVEYFRYFLEFLNRQERVSNRIDNNIGSLKSLFKFQVEERLECMESHQVRYSSAEDVVLKLDIDLTDCKDKDILEQYIKQHEARRVKKEEEKLRRAKEAADKEKGKSSDNSNDDKASATTTTITTTTTSGTDNSNSKEAKSSDNNDDEKEILPEIPLEASLKRFLNAEIINDWMSPATHKRGQAKKSHALATFPQYLALQVSRYYMTESWTAEKHDCVVPVPQELDISFMRAKGMQANEKEMAKDSGAANGNKNGKMEADATIVSTLVNMGLASENACKRAALAVQNANADMAAAWLFEHMTDADINDAIEDPKDDKNDANGGAYEPDKDKVASLAAMFGFEAKYVRTALIETNGDENRAAEWLFSHEATLDAETDRVNNEREASKKEKSDFSDGKGVYEMVAIISHLGKDTGHGHYVSHVKRHGKWYFFNDNKVALSKETPFQHGYLYIFQRKSE